MTRLEQLLQAAIDATAAAAGLDAASVKAREATAAAWHAANDAEQAVQTELLAMRKRMSAA